MMYISWLSISDRNTSANHPMQTPCSRSAFTNTHIWHGTAAAFIRRQYKRWFSIDQNSNAKNQMLDLFSYSLSLHLCFGCCFYCRHWYSYCGWCERYVYPVEIVKIYRWTHWRCQSGTTRRRQQRRRPLGLARIWTKAKNIDALDMF